MSTEHIRIKASKQYFEFRNELNRANKSKNQKTDLEFLIRQNENEDFIVIKSTEAMHGLRIAFRLKNATGRWFLSDNETYQDFYKYMFIKISQLHQANELNINDILRTWLFQLWIS